MRYEIGSGHVSYGGYDGPFRQPGWNYIQLSTRPWRMSISPGTPGNAAGQARASASRVCQELQVIQKLEVTHRTLEDIADRFPNGFLTGTNPQVTRVHPTHSVGLIPDTLILKIIGTLSPYRKL